MAPMAFATTNSPQRVTTNSGQTTTVVPPSKGNPTLPFTPNPSPAYTPPPSQLPYTATSASTATLPFTGIDIAEMAGIGTGAIAIGALLMAARRRRTAA